MVALDVDNHIKTELGLFYLSCFLKKESQILEEVYDVRSLKMEDE